MTKLEMQFISLRSGSSSLVPYSEAWAFQKECVEKRIADEIPDTFLFVEHPPTITRGRGLQGKAGRAMPLESVPAGTEYFEVERGGDLTWHGPGQLVIYPIVKLDGRGFGPAQDITGFLRKLERELGRWFALYGIRTEAREGATGLWATRMGASPKASSSARKIASIGIAVRKWVTYHGAGLNLANSLDGFRGFAPCGFSSEVMTSLREESPDFARNTWSSSMRSEIEAQIADVLVADGAKQSDADCIRRLIVPLPLELVIVP